MTTWQRFVVCTGMGHFEWYEVFEVCQFCRGVLVRRIGRRSGWLPFSTVVTKGCDVHGMLDATSDPSLLARMPTPMRHECNLVVGYLGNP